MFEPSRVRLIYLLLCFGLLANVASAKESKKLIHEETLTMALMGHEIGEAKSADFKTQEGFRSERESNLSIKRGPSTINMRSKTVATADKNLRPLRFVHVKDDSSGKSKTKGKVVGKTLHLEITQAGNTTRQEVAMPQDAHFASTFEIYKRENLKDGFRFSGKIFLEEMATFTDLELQIRKNADGTFMATSKMMGMENLSHLDAKGRVILDRTDAMSALAYPKGKKPGAIQSTPVNLFERTVWKAPNIPRDAKSVVFRFHSPKAKTFELPTGPNQRILKRTKKYLDVKISRGVSEKLTLDKAGRAQLLKETPYEAISHPEIKNAAKNAVKGARSDLTKVAVLTKYVYDLVDAKDLDRGYAPALTTLRDRKGDCTEHAILLSALLRSQGFPTRLVDGVVATSGIVGYHEWVEVYIEGKGMVPADPSFNEFPAGPSRMALHRGDSTPEGLLEMGIAAARLLGEGVRVEVLRFD